MSEFEAGATLDVRVDPSSLRSAREEIERELGDVTVDVNAVAEGGGRGGDIRGREAAMERQLLTDQNDSLQTIDDHWSENLELNRERNELLRMLVDETERQSREQRSGRLGKGMMVGGAGVALGLGALLGLGEGAGLGELFDDVFEDFEVVPEDLIEQPVPLTVEDLLEERGAVEPEDVIREAVELTAADLVLEQIEMGPEHILMEAVELTAADMVLDRVELGPADVFEGAIELTAADLILDAVGLSPGDLIEAPVSLSLEDLIDAVLEGAADAVDDAPGGSSGILGGLLAGGAGAVAVFDAIRNARGGAPSAPSRPGMPSVRGPGIGMPLPQIPAIDLVGREHADRFRPEVGEFFGDQQMQLTGGAGIAGVDEAAAQALIERFTQDVSADVSQEIHVDGFRELEREMERSIEAVEREIEDLRNAFG